MSLTKSFCRGSIRLDENLNGATLIEESDDSAVLVADDVSSGPLSVSECSHAQQSILSGGTKCRSVEPDLQQDGHAESAKSRQIFFANITWMLVGNVAYGLSQWALLVTLAKIGTIELVGNFALAVAVVLPVFMFSSLSLRSLQITDTQGLYRFREYISLRLLTLAASMLFIFVFGLVSGYSTTVLVATLLIAGAKAFEYISDLLYGLLQKKEDMSGIAISMTLRAILSVVTLAVGVSLTRSLVWGALGLLITSAAVLVFYDLPTSFAGQHKRPILQLRRASKYFAQLGNRDYRRVLNLALSGLPMGIVLMMVSLNINIPRFFIQRHLGMAELGIFSAIATLMASGSVVTNAIGQAAAPRLSKYFVAGDKRRFRLLLSALVVASLGFGALGLAGAIVFGQRGMTAIYRPEYSTRQDVLLWLMGASGFFYLGSTLGYAVTAVRCFAPQLPLFVGSAAITGIASFFFIPKFGLPGAAMAILISSIVQCVGNSFLLYRSQKPVNSLVGATT